MTVAAAFATVLVRVIGIGDVVALRVAGVVHAPYVLGNLSSAVVK